MDYINLTQIKNLSIYHVVREDKAQFKCEEIITFPHGQRNFSHMPPYKQTTEIQLEEERRTKYPNYPSRLDCLFVSLNEESALNWAKEKFRSGGHFYLYKLLLLDGKIINLDANWIDAIGEIFSNGKIPTTHKYSIEECLNGYWDNNSFQENNDSMREILLYGKIKVISKKLMLYNRILCKFTEL